MSIRATILEGVLGVMWATLPLYAGQVESGVCTSVSSAWEVCCPTLGWCVARSENVLLFVDTDGLPHLAVAAMQPDRLSVLNGRFSRDLPNLIAKPLSQEEVRLLSQQGAHLVVQAPDMPLTLVGTQGLGTAVDLIREQLGSNAYTLQTGVETDKTPPALQRFEEMQNLFDAPPSLFLPAVKPQAQMAIRAQNGLALPVVSGSGMHIDHSNDIVKK